MVKLRLGHGIIALVPVTHKVGQSHTLALPLLSSTFDRRQKSVDYRLPLSRLGIIHASMASALAVPSFDRGISLLVAALGANTLLVQGNAA